MSGQDLGEDSWRPRWTEGEAREQVRQVNTALRQSRTDLIESALESFGAPPMNLFCGQKESGHPLDASTETLSAFGFARLLTASVERHAYEEHGYKPNWPALGRKSVGAGWK